MKVSVLMITYNHEKFIGEALDSVLMQCTDFDYEIVVGEDCSTDRTREIIAEYEQKHPEKIRLFPSSQNLGMLRNFVRTFKACTGQYIAILDGDDYWISPCKLQKQVDFLDAHLECSACFHKGVGNCNESGKSFIMEPPHERNNYSVKDLVAGNFIFHGSVMYRSGILADFPPWWYSVDMTDWTTYILYAQHGEFGYINELMGIYRIHPNGVWSNRSDIKKIQENIKTYELFNEHLNHVYDKEIRTIISNSYYKLSLLCHENGDRKMAKIFASKCFLAFPFNRNISRSVQIKVLLKYHMFWLFDIIKTNLTQSAEIPKS